MSAVESTAPTLRTSRYEPGAAVLGRRLGYATILPREYYTSAEIFEAEFERVFSRQWILVGHISQIAEVGDYFVQEFAHESVLVVRESRVTGSTASTMCAGIAGTAFAHRRAAMRGGWYAHITTGRSASTEA